MKTKIRISGSTGQKLQFVKLIKEHTGLGLKESKDLVDGLLPSGIGYPKYLDYIEIEVTDAISAAKTFKEIGLDVSTSSRECKLKRVLYQDQVIMLKDMLEDVSQWDKFISNEDKTTLTYDECRRKAIETVYENYSEYINNDSFNALYDEIKNINEMEIKSTDAKILKFNEEFGEFVAEYIKFKGYTYKPYDKDHLKEEMADSFQCLLSIFAAIEKETGITLKDILLEMFVKNKKWIDKISDYKVNKN